MPKGSTAKLPAGCKPGASFKKMCNVRYNTRSNVMNYKDKQDYEALVTLVVLLCVLLVVVY